MESKDGSDITSLGYWEDTRNLGNKEGLPRETMNGIWFMLGDFWDIEKIFI